jgi:hypothetical protein
MDKRGCKWRTTKKWRRLWKFLLECIVFVHDYLRRIPNDLHYHGLHFVYSQSNHNTQYWRNTKLKFQRALLNKYFSQKRLHAKTPNFWWNWYYFQLERSMLFRCKSTVVSEEYGAYIFRTEGKNCKGEVLSVLNLLSTMPWRHVGEWRYSSTIFDLDGGEWSASYPSHFTHGERVPDTHWIGGWVGPRAGLDIVEKRKIVPLPVFEPRPFQPVARRYINWSIPTPFQGWKVRQIRNKYEVGNKLCFL